MFYFEFLYWIKELILLQTNIVNSLRLLEYSLAIVKISSKYWSRDAIQWEDK